MESMTRNIISYGFGKAVLYTPYSDIESRFMALAGTCFGIRKSIAGFWLINSEHGMPENIEADEAERLEFNGDIYIWRADGARKMLEPWPDEEWDESYCEECCCKEEENK